MAGSIPSPFSRHQHVRTDKQSIATEKSSLPRKKHRLRCFYGGCTFFFNYQIWINVKVHSPSFCHSDLDVAPNKLSSISKFNLRLATSTLASRTRTSPPS